MILDIGEKVHIIERRTFNEDLRRHFIGEVVRCTENAIRVQGHPWVFDATRGEFIRKLGKRDRVLFPGDRLVINVIPEEVDLRAIRYVTKPEMGIVVTDDKQYSLDINEFGVKR